MPTQTPWLVVPLGGTTMTLQGGTRSSSGTITTSGASVPLTGLLESYRETDDPEMQRIMPMDSKRVNNVYKRSNIACHFKGRLLDQTGVSGAVSSQLKKLYYSSTYIQITAVTGGNQLSGWFTIAGYELEIDDTTADFDMTLAQVDDGVGPAYSSVA